MSVSRSSDPERFLEIYVTVKIPFYGKEHQAQTFADHRLKDILRTGISDKVEISSLLIQDRPEILANGNSAE